MRPPVAGVKCNSRETGDPSPPFRIRLRTSRRTIVSRSPRVPLPPVPVPVPLPVPPPLSPPLPAACSALSPLLASRGSGCPRAAGASACERSRCTSQDRSRPSASGSASALPGCGEIPPQLVEDHRALVPYARSSADGLADFPAQPPHCRRRRGTPFRVRNSLRGKPVMGRVLQLLQQHTGIPVPRLD